MSDEYDIEKEMEFVNSPIDPPIIPIYFCINVEKKPTLNEVNKILDHELYEWRTVKRSDTLKAAMGEIKEILPELILKAPEGIVNVVNLISYEKDFRKENAHSLFINCYAKEGIEVTVNDGDPFFEYSCLLESSFYDAKHVNSYSWVENYKDMDPIVLALRCYPEMRRQWRNELTFLERHGSNT